MILFEAEDAYKQIKRGYFVASGGYVYGNDIYFAFGTFPGCRRNGKIDLENLKGKSWRLLSFEDLIKLSGFYPIPARNLYDALKGTPYCEDALKHELNMISFMIDSKYSSEDFHCSFKANRIWSEYFAQGEELESDFGNIS